MITLEEILKGRVKFEDLPKEHQENLKVLLERINILREKYGKPLKVNDGYRRASDQPKNAAKSSKHLIGAAIDLDDDEAGTLWKWVFANLELMKSIGLWMEHPNWTHNKKYGTWIHFQIYPPKSNKRVFIPSNEADPNPKFWDSKYDSKFD